MSSSISSISKIIQEVREYAKTQLSAKRFQHSLSTAQNARTIAKAFAFSPTYLEKTNLAGLGHDIARERDAEECIALAREDYFLEDWEIEYPIVLHGKAGAVLLKKEFSLRDEAVMEAIAWHTTGKPGMGTVAKILFIADYIRPETGVECQLTNITLDELIVQVIEGKKKYAQKKGYPILPPLEALDREYRIRIS